MLNRYTVIVVGNLFNVKNQQGLSEPTDFIVGIMELLRFLHCTLFFHELLYRS